MLLYPILLRALKSSQHYKFRFDHYSEQLESDCVLDNHGASLRSQSLHVQPFAVIPEHRFVAIHLLAVGTVLIMYLRPLPQLWESELEAIHGNQEN